MQSMKCSEGPFNGVKVVSATMVADRMMLGEKVTAWIERKRAEVEGFQLREIGVTQSSDEAFHCIAMTVFYWEPIASTKR